MPAATTLSPTQAGLLDRWLPGHRVLGDHSWGQVETTVLHLTHGGRELTAKAFGPGNHHFERELEAHRTLTAPLLPDRIPTLVQADEEARLLVTTWLPGRLVQGEAAEWEPDTYRQAGRLTALLHGQARRVDPQWHSEQPARARAWLDRPHRIPEGVEARVREALTAWPTGPVELTPTHGDLQPRNWLVDRGRVAFIDLGRAGWRPPTTDLARLAAQQWRGRPELEAAFLEGYGADPRPVWWPLVLLTEAIGTAVWAHQVGDERFEAQGHRMLREALDLC